MYNYSIQITCNVTMWHEKKMRYVAWCYNYWGFLKVSQKFVYKKGQTENYINIILPPSKSCLR